MYRKQHNSQRIASSKYRQATYWLGVIIIGLTVGIGVQAAFTEPSGPPPSQTVSGPLTTGDANQTKAGGLTLGRNFATNGFSTDCPNGWQCGVHTQDVYAEGVVLSMHDMFMRGSNFFMGNEGKTTVYGDDTNIAVRMPGDFYIEHGWNNPAPARAWDVWLSRANNGNGKWASEVGGVGGNGNAGWVTKWTGGTTVGNSRISDDGTVVGVYNPLWVNGQIATENNLYVNGQNVVLGRNGSVLYGNGTDTAIRQDGTLRVTNKAGTETRDLQARSITAAGDLSANNATLRGGLLTLSDDGSRMLGDGTNVKIGVDGEVSVTDRNGNGSKSVRAWDVYLNKVNKWASEVAGPQITREASESGQVGAVVAATTATCADGAVAVGGGGWCEIQPNGAGVAGLLMGSRPQGNTQWRVDCGSNQAGYWLNAHAYVICAK